MLQHETKAEAFTSFVEAHEASLRAALTAVLGTEVGREAAAEALAYGWANWDRVSTMDNPIGYLYRMGRNLGRRMHRRRRVLLPTTEAVGEPLVEPGLLETPILTSKRGIAKRAADASSPYYTWFMREEGLASWAARTSGFKPAHVAKVVAQVLKAKRPKLRYMVGWRAKLVARLRRHIPGELFERIYFGEIIRRVTKEQLSGGVEGEKSSGQKQMRRRV